MISFFYNESKKMTRRHSNISSTPTSPLCIDFLFLYKERYVIGGNSIGCIHGPLGETKDNRDQIIHNPATGKGIAVSGIVYKSDGTPVYGTPEEPKSVEEQLSRILTFKWEVQTNIPLGEDASLNVPALRLGEVMLTYAEAENELGHLEEAKTYVDKIRSRAGLENLPANLNMASMRDAILDERGWELYHEGYRREDLVRHGKLLEKVNEKYHYYFW